MSDTSQDQVTEGRATPTAPKTIGEYAGRWWVNVKSGELGALPIVIGLIVIVTRVDAQ